MSEDVNELKEQIASLQKELEEAKTQYTTFDEIKTKYENIIKEKDNKINELEQTVETNQNQIDETVTSLNNEVQAKLEQTEAYKELQATVKQLERERAEATVDTYIQKGILLPTQKDSAVKLCLNDNETFLNLYRDAKPIVDTQTERKSIPTGTAERIANYFKN
jgi:DNA repair exonuclease SbcCD ATPase subunit